MSNRTARRALCGLILVAIAGGALLTPGADPPAAPGKPVDSTLQLSQRSRPREGGAPTEKPAQWDARQTAVIICDMWDKHTCASAMRRGAEIAPGVDALAKEVRAKGGLIIHCPSDTMKFYEGTPQRLLAQKAPKATPPTPLKGWRFLDLTREAALPIDDKDGGCDDLPQCAKAVNRQWPWMRQAPAIEIAPGDAVTQDGGEVYNLFAQRGIKHVIICGVHLNMCVLGRTFGIRQLTDWKFEVVLARDLTDTMYNPRLAPQVSHEKGTELVIEHVEKYWCPTITSDQIVKSKSR